MGAGWVSVISAVVAVGSAAITALLSAREGRERIKLQAEIDVQQATQRKRDEQLDLMSRIRDPLLWAAFDLQSRIFNIVNLNFLSEYLLNGSEEEHEYARLNTIYVFAQYLCWVEIVRRRVQFLDLGSKQENRKLVNFFSVGASILSADSFRDPLFRIFRGDQRGIGEVMIDTRADGELICIGYAEFYRMMDTEPSFARWFTNLSTSIDQLAAADTCHNPRLVAFQENLIGLIDLLDPEASRFPERYRGKAGRKE